LVSDVDIGGAGFGARLRGWREAAGLSQQQLADRSGLSVRAVSNMERGRTQWPYRDSLSRLADALGLRETARADFFAAVPRRQLARQPVAASAVAARCESRTAFGGDGRSVPRQLPATARHFTGREAELSVLDQMLAAADLEGPGTGVISAIGGTAGVGKTALALRWAHQVSDHFPDGQLYMNLRGYDAGEPVPAEEALAASLRALGMPGPDVPAGAEERAAAYRTLLAGRKMLIVLDNAAQVEHVRPLLPGDAGCVTLVTSRDTLAGLVARDGAVPVMLGLLPLTDAVALLRKLIGQRVETEPEAAATLAAMCCRLPLALRVAAELAASRPRLALAALVDDLAGQGRLDQLDAGSDQATAVRAVFSWSYQGLSAAAARTFRLTALHPGTDFDLGAVAAMTGVNREVALRAVRELTRAHLLWSTRQDRYGTHDLLRGFATELATAHDDETSRRDALTRLLDYYLGTVCCAASILFPAEVASLPSRGDVSGTTVMDERRSRAWLDTERANLTTIASYAMERGWPDHAVGLSAGLFRYLDTGGFLDQALVIHQAAVQAAVQAGDRVAEARAMVNVGTVYLHQGRFEMAEQHCRHALALGRETCDDLGQLRALGNLGPIYVRMGDYSKAADCSQRALDLCRKNGDRTGEARALQRLGEVAIWQGHYRNAVACLLESAEKSRLVGDLACQTFALSSLGEVEVRLGHYSEARGHLEEAEVISRESGHASGAAHATCFLGVSDLRQGHYEQAAKRLEQALVSHRQAGATVAQAEVLCYLGEVELQAGRLELAEESFARALAFFREAAATGGEALAQNGLGATACARRALDAASAHHRTALTIAIEISNLEQQARAHEGLGNLTAAAGNGLKARDHWREALALYAKLETPDVERIRAWLAPAALPQAAEPTPR
jgi:tetratricopeptide (TPR) repeat protein/transcriptional regulator with XRE-family HTH domain